MDLILDKRVDAKTPVQVAQYLALKLGTNANAQHTNEISRVGYIESQTIGTSWFMSCPTTGSCKAHIALAVDAPVLRPNEYFWIF